jgi:hypothetical protein
LPTRLLASAGENNDEVGYGHTVQSVGEGAPPVDADTETIKQSRDARTRRGVVMPRVLVRTAADKQ